MPLISVLIPVYEVEKYIEQCLTSLFDCSMSELCEFVIVNDCTHDNSINLAKQVIQRYPSINLNNVKFINHEKNSGIAATRNTALKNASGEYIIFVDSDDWVEKDYLEKMYKAAKSLDADIVGCDWYEERPEKSTVQNLNLVEDCEKNFKDFMQCKIPAQLWSKMIKRSLIIENSFSFCNDINNWEDEIFFTKLFSVSKKISYVKSPLYHYRVRLDSYIRCLITDKTKNDFLNAISEMENYLISNKLNENQNLLNFKKIHAKQKILLDGTRAMQKKYLHLWPEILSSIFEDNSIKNRTKKILYYADKCPFISLTILFIQSALKIILRKQFTWKQYFSKQ